MHAGAFSLWLCLWPGLPRLWCRGEWRALWLALLFSLAINVWLVCTFVFRDWLPSAYLWMGWLLLATTWLVCVWRSRRSWPVAPTAVDGQRLDQLLAEARGEYLKGHWLEAESLLKQAIELHDRDVDAHLLLVSLLRRTERWDEAHSRLESLAAMTEAKPWKMEMERERRWLERRREQATDEESRGEERRGD